MMQQAMLLVLLNFNCLETDRATMQQQRGGSSVRHLTHFHDVSWLPLMR
jgi:hypothetical protein